jgi:hypothetical protein
VIDVCANLQEYPTGIQGVPGATKFFGNDCEWHLLPATAIDQITPLGTGADAVAGTTLVLGKDGLWHKLPASIETSLTVTDTATVDLTSSGTYGHTLKADVKISAADCNAIVENADGIWSQYRPPMFSGTATVSNLQTIVNATIAGYPLNTDISVGSATYDYTNTECVPMRVLVFANPPNTTFQQVAAGNRWFVGFGPTSTPFVWSAGQDIPVGGSPHSTFLGRGFILIAQATVAPGDTFTADAQVSVRIENFVSNGNNAISIGTSRFFVWAWPLV